jgi:hypothetical protein
LGATVGLLALLTGIAIIVGRRLGTPWHFTP